MTSRLDLVVKNATALTLEEAINCATYVPAQDVLGLAGRGVLRSGAFADVVVLDPERIRMVGDYFAPSRPPDGIECVIVNGQVAYKDKTFTAARSGRVLRRS